MILPMSVTQYAEAWKGLAAGTTRFSSGKTTKITQATAPSAAQPLGPYRRENAGEFGPILNFHGSPLQGEHALWAPLDEEDDEHEHRDLGEHGALPGFEQLVGEAQPQGRVDRACELPHAAENHHHEGIDDVGLPEIGADIADLRQRAAGQAGNARAQAEGQGIDARGGHADAGSHGAVLSHAANEQPQACFREEQPYPAEHGSGKEDDDDAAPRQYDVCEHFDAARHPHRVFDLHVGRAEYRSYSLNQRETDTPGREQRLKRPAVEPANHAALERHADERRDHERRRHCASEVPIESTGRVPSEQVLHHVCRIRAYHDELAVRHIDHAHQPVGNGEAKRREEKDGAEAYARENYAGALAPGEAAFDLAQAP